MRIFIEHWDVIEMPDNLLFKDGVRGYEAVHALHDMVSESVSAWLDAQAGKARLAAQQSKRAGAIQELEKAAQAKEVDDKEDVPF